VWLGLAAVAALAVGSWHRTETRNEQCVSRVQQEALVHLDLVDSSSADREAVSLATPDLAALETFAARAAAALDQESSGRPSARDFSDALEIVDRLRENYAWIASSPELTRGFLVLADANQQRIAFLAETVRSGFDRARYDCLSDGAVRLWREITVAGARVRVPSGRAWPEFLRAGKP
jgi:hypothetical protein